jgi:hypothetical protein
MSNTIEPTKTMKFEDAYILATNNIFDEEPIDAQEDEQSKISFLKYRDGLLATPKEKLSPQQCINRILIQAAEIYARAKWDEACIATRKSMTEESGLMPPFNP